MRSAPLKAFLELVKAEKLMKGSVSRTDDVPGAFVLNGEGCGYFFCRVVMSDLARVSARRALCAIFGDARHFAQSCHFALRALLCAK